MFAAALFAPLLLLVAREARTHDPQHLLLAFRALDILKRAGDCNEFSTLEHFLREQRGARTHRGGSRLQRRLLSRYVMKYGRKTGWPSLDAAWEQMAVDVDVALLRGGLETGRLLPIWVG